MISPKGSRKSQKIAFAFCSLSLGQFDTPIGRGLYDALGRVKLDGQGFCLCLGVRPVIVKPSERARVKVVAHLRDHTLVKGYMDDGQASSELTVAPVINLLRATDREEIAIAASDLKALFFVKSFEGQKDYKEMKFFKIPPATDGIWVGMRFYDNESTEGIVKNSIHFLLPPGFFLTPPDPQSNNESVYVVTNSLAEFHVLGLRSSTSA